MAKKKSLFSILKRLFIPDTHSRLEKKDKRKRWLFRLVKAKQLPPLSAPSPPMMLPQTTAEENNGCDSPTDNLEQLTEIQSTYQYKESQDFEDYVTHVKVSQIHHQYERALQDLAAIKIQAVYRGYLARKALRALKGVVKLQALIRGWAVRRQAINTLKCLQSIVNIQSEVCSKRCERIGKTLHNQEYRSQDFREKDIKVDVNSQKRWDDSILTKNESKAHHLSKREASIKRERIKEYYLNHRRSAETERDRVYGRRRYWLEQWVDAQLAKRDDIPKLGRTLSDKARNRDEAGEMQLSLKYLQKAEMASSPANSSRRSFYHRKQRSTGEDNTFPGSPSLPTYMASTESAKAKARSISSPRLRPISCDVCSEITSPYKHKLSPISSINSELTCSSWVGNAIGSSQRSPSLKGLAGPIKSNISTKDLRLHGIRQQDAIDATVSGNTNLYGK